MNFFKQKGVSLVELLVAGLLLVLAGLLISSLFLQGSVSLITLGEETVVLSCMQELSEEVRGIAREYYRFIRVENPTNKPCNHHHINIPAFVLANGPVYYTVVAHDADHNRTSAANGSPVTVQWEQKEGGTVTCNFQEIDLTNGIGSGAVIFTSNSSKSGRGVLNIQASYGTSNDVAGILVYPQSGEQIRQRGLRGTRTATFELFDDPLDEIGANDILPGDYMRGTVTFIFEDRKGKGKSSKELVTIIAPWPEEE